MARCFNILKHYSTRYLLEIGLYYFEKTYRGNNLFIINNEIGQ